MNFNCLTISFEDHSATIWMDRPKVRNAFNDLMIRELIQAFEYLEQQQEVVFIKLRGKGPVFCAGADLNWMKDVAKFTFQENYDESLNLSKCFYTIYHCSKPTIAMVHGAAIGGANGLLTACDIAIAEENTKFSLSEVKIGLIPACIGPYLVKRVGEFTARELMLTGKRFNGKEAYDYKLVNVAASEEEMEVRLNKISEQLCSSGPHAMQQCKKLLQNVSNHWTFDEAYAKTAEMIAQMRMSDEGQEGMQAFLEKRTPKWKKES